jgi:beta-1,2-rhamnosyltransferase WsaF-like protein
MVRPRSGAPPSAPIPPPRGWSTADIERYRDLAEPQLVKVPTIEVDPRLTDTPRLTILMPHLTMGRMTGGPNTALNLTGRLAALGVPLRFVGVAGPMDADTGPLRDHVERLSQTSLPPAAAEFQAAGPGGEPLRIGRRDVVVATWWPTAHVARAVLDRTEAREFIYLVQDYEPGFYPWSVNHALARATYDFPARAVVNERFLLEYLRGEGGGIFSGDGPERVISFEPSVDRALFHPETDQRPRRRLLFYARPRNERNLFDLGIRALRDVVARGDLTGDRWDVVAIGSQMPTLDLGPDLQMSPSPWLDYPAYAGLLRGSDLLLCLMLSPHTSYPPLEMAASGRLVVTTEFGPKTAAGLASISPLIRASPADPSALTTVLADAIGDAERHEPATSFHGPASWDEAFADVVPWFRTAIREIGGW